MTDLIRSEKQLAEKSDIYQRFQIRPKEKLHEQNKLNESLDDKHRPVFLWPPLFFAAGHECSFPRVYFDFSKLMVHESKRLTLFFEQFVA
jgi:hypothetical protein